MLNHLTSRQDPVYDEISILRHLHCNERVHGPLGTVTGSPVLEPPKEVLLVIADYYDCQIVVLRYHPREGEHDIALQDRWFGAVYTAETFGQPVREGDDIHQIFLVTSDYRHFGYVEHTGETGPTQFITGPECRVKFPSPWWQDGFQPRAQNAHPPLERLPIPPFQIPHFIPDDDKVAGVPETVLWPPGPLRLTDEVLYRYFRNHRDLPGLNLRGLPTVAYMNSWDDPVEDEYSWRIEREAFGQIRFGGGQRLGNQPIPANSRTARHGGLDLLSVFHSFHREFPLYGKHQPKSAQPVSGENKVGDGEQKKDGDDRDLDVAKVTKVMLEELDRVDAESEAERQTGSRYVTKHAVREMLRADAVEFLEQYNPDALEQTKSTKRASPRGTGQERPNKRQRTTKQRKQSEVPKKSGRAAAAEAEAARDAARRAAEREWEEGATQLDALLKKHQGKKISARELAKLPKPFRDELKRHKDAEEMREGLARLEALQEQYKNTQIPPKELAKLPRALKEGLKSEAAQARRIAKGKGKATG